MLNLTEALSDVSRTNQLKITQSKEEVADNLFQYLFRMDKGINCFPIKDWFTKEDRSKPDFYKERHKRIKEAIQKRLSEHGKKPKYSDIQYFLSYANGGNVFFLSPNKTHSGWKKLFCENKNNSNRERIFNLIFKFHILAQDLSVETINGFEELLLVHSKEVSKSEDKLKLFVWGQNVFVNYNYHDVLTLKLTRKHRLFLPKDDHSILDSEEIGELLVYKDKKYYFKRDLDARRENSIVFMRFDKDDEDFDKFKETQLFHYQNLMTQLENFLDNCGIAYEVGDFQADHYLKDAFIKLENVESVETLEIINNTGADLTESDKQCLERFFKHQGVSSLTFYQAGKTISIYEQEAPENEEDSCWKITEVIPWSDVKLDKDKNYLVFNKLLEEEAGSMAYQREDGLWYPSTKISGKPKVDFYSRLKKRFSYLDTGAFYSTQGINLTDFRVIKDDNKTSRSVLTYNPNKIDEDILRQDTRDFTDERFLDIEDSIICYLQGQVDSEKWAEFRDKHKIKISPEFEKVLIELGIKNWVRESLKNPNFGLPIREQPFSEKRFFTIYVRSPKKEEAKAVAVEFLYKKGYIYVKDVIRDIREVKKRFRFLRKRSNSEKLKDDQQYFVDEDEKVYISCYTDDKFTPTLIGRNGILEDMEAGKLKINRRASGEDSDPLLPLVMRYNEVKPINRIQNMVCFDLKNPTFIQYYIPPKQSLDTTSKRGFRIYHLFGKTYDNDKPIPTSELIKHPITALHFSTLTQDILKIRENSQSSLLQKVAKVFVEN